MNPSKRSLLAIVEAGGYPDLSSLYVACGFTPTVAYSARKSLSLCRTIKPDVIVAEFRYGPMYGSRVSNMESLIAAIQVHCPNASLIVLMDAEDRPHFERVTKSFPVFNTLTFPLNQDTLADMLRSIPATDSPGSR